MATTTPRRTWRAREPLNANLTIAMTAEMRRDVEDVADAQHGSAADVVRECIDLALPRIRERARKRRGRRPDATADTPPARDSGK